MPLPAGTIPLLGPVIDTSGALLTASTALRDAGAISLRGGMLQKVNSAGTGWEPVPGHVVQATAPTTGLFEGLLWYDTTTNTLMAHNGTAFQATGSIAREFARTNAVTFTGSGTPNITPTDVNNGRIWNYTDSGTPTMTFASPGVELGNWRAMVAHTGSGGEVTIQAPAGTELARLHSGDSGLAIFARTPSAPNGAWQFVFVGRNPNEVTQAEAEAGTVADPRTWTPQRVAQAIAALSPSGGGSVTFGTGSGEVATWAEGDNTDAFPLAKVDGAQQSTQAAMRIRWAPSQAGLNASRFEAGQESIGNTKDGVGAPTSVALNEFLGIWIGTAEANVLDIVSRGASVFGNLFANAAAGEPLTVAGTAGTVYRTTAAVSAATWMLQIFRARLNPVHFGDVVDARIRGDVEYWALDGDTDRIPSAKIPAFTDDQILDVAQATRTTADRGKPLGLSAADENALVLLDIGFAQMSDVIDLRAMMPLCSRSTGARPNIATLGTPTASESTTGGYHQWVNLPTGWSTTYAPPDETNTHAWGLIAYQKRTREGWQDDFLFYVGLEDTYVAAGGEIEVGTGRGALIATSSTLPTANQGNGSAYTGVSWSGGLVADTSVAWVTTSGVTVRLGQTNMIPTGVDGIWCVYEVGGTETGRVKLPFGGSRGGNDDRMTPVSSMGHRIAIQSEMIVGAANAIGYRLVGAGSTLPANTVAKLYWSLIGAGAKGDPGDDAALVFGSGAGEVSPIAEGNNTDPWPFSKLPVGLNQAQAEVRLAWNTSTSWTSADVVVSMTGQEINIPTPEAADTQLQFLVLIDASDELRDILIGGSAADGAAVFTNAPVLFTLNGVNYQHYISATLDESTKAALSASTIEVRLDANTHDQHVRYLTEEYLEANPVIEGVTLSDDAFTTLNSAGESVALTWPSALTQSGGGGTALEDLRALRDAGQILPYVTSNSLIGSTPTVDNPGNLNDGDLTTFTVFNGGTKRGLVLDWGRVVRRARVHVWASGQSSFGLRGVNASGDDIGNLLTVQTVNGKTVWDTGERDLRGVFLAQASGASSVNIFLIYVEDTRLTELVYSASDRRVHGTGITLPEFASVAGLAAETTARESADTALGVRIDALTAEPTEGESLLELVASTYPRDIRFTLGTRIPGGSDPGYNKGTHSLTAAGAFSEAGIPTDIVTLYRVTESEVINTVQLQNRLLVGVDEPGGSTRYQGERIRWGGQIVRLTFLQRSLNNFNEYYTDVVTTLSTAGQSVAFNIEDVQAEARDAIPYPRWIWHHAAASTTGLTSDDKGVLAGFAYEAAGGTIIDSTTLTAAILGDGRVGYSREGPLGSLSPGNLLVYEISERTNGSTKELTVRFGYQETGFAAGSTVEIDGTEYPYLSSAFVSANNTTLVSFLTNPAGTTARITSGTAHIIRLKRSNGSYIEFTGSTYIPPQVLFRDPQVVEFNLRNVQKDRFPDFLDFDQDPANTMRDLKLIVEERTPEEVGTFDDLVGQVGNAGAADHAFFFHIRDHDVNNAVRQYDHTTPDTSGLFPAGTVDFTNRLVLLIRDSLRGTKTPSNLLYWRGEDGALQTLSLTLRVVLNTGQFATDPLSVYFTDAVTVLTLNEMVSINVEYSDDSRLHAPNPEAFNERTLDKAGTQTWLGIAVTPEMQQALDYDYISSAAFSQDINLPASTAISYANLQAVAVPQTPQIAEDCRVRLTFTQSESQTGTARFYYRQGNNYYPLVNADSAFIELTGSGSIDLFLTEDYFDGNVLRLAARETTGALLQFSYSATYDFYRSAESLKRSIIHTLIAPGVQHTLARNDFATVPGSATQNMVAFTEAFRLSELEYITMELSFVNANNLAAERVTFTIYGTSLRRQGAINLADGTALSNWHSDGNAHRTLIPGRFYPRPTQIEGVTSGKITEVRNNGVHNGQPIFIFAFRRSGAFITGIQTMTWAAAGSDYRIGAMTAQLRR